MNQPGAILHVLRDLDLTGVPRFVSHFVNSATCREAGTRNFVFSYFGGTLADSIQEGAEIIHYAKRFRLDFGIVPAIRRTFEDRKVDALIVHSNPWGLIATWLYRLPCIYVFHVAPKRLTIGDRIFCTVLRSISRRPNCRLVAVSVALAKVVAERLGVPNDRIRTIHNGIPIHAAAGHAHGPDLSLPISLACIGSLCRIKGQHVLISAIRMLLERGLAVPCHLVGEGPSRAELEAQAYTEGVSHLVRFAGYQPVDPFLKEHRPTCVVVPSLSETFGFTILEAWSHGIPVVASSVDGPAEVIEPAVSGLLFSPGDAVELAGIIERFASEPGLARKLMHGAQVRLRQFSIDRCVANYLRCCRELAKGRGLEQ